MPKNSSSLAFSQDAKKMKIIVMQMGTVFAQIYSKNLSVHTKTNTTIARMDQSIDDRQYT